MKKLFESLVDKLKPASPVDVSKLDSIDATTKEILTAIVKPTSPVDVSKLESIDTTTKDTVGNRGYIPYDLDNPGGALNPSAAPRPKPIIPRSTDGAPGIEPTPPSTIAPINTWGKP